MFVRIEYPKLWIEIRFLFFQSVTFRYSNFSFVYKDIVEI